MAIHCAQLVEQTVEFPKASDISTSRYNRTYSLDYQVIVDGADLISDIVELVRDWNGRAHALPDVTLPFYKSANIPNTANLYMNTPIQRVSVSVWGEPNMKAVPSRGLSAKADVNARGYAIWKYHVECGEDQNAGGGSQSSIDLAPWKSEYAYNCNLSAKVYTEKNCYGYMMEKISDTQAKFHKVIVQNAVKDRIYRDKSVFNLLLTFDYAVQFKDEDIKNALPFLYYNSTNYNTIMVAGYEIPRGKGVLRNLTLTSAEWKDQLYSVVHVEIEIEVEYNITPVKILGTSRNAKAETLTAQNKNIVYPIHRFTGTPTDLNSLKNVVWLDKERYLGNFSNAKYSYGGKEIAFTAWEPVDEPQVLTTKGQIYKGKKGAPGVVDLDDKTLDMISIYDCKPKDWAALNFPAKGLFPGKTAIK